MCRVLVSFFVELEKVFKCRHTHVRRHNVQLVAQGMNFSQHAI